MEIPTKLKNHALNFVLLEKSGKRPFQQGWQKKEIKFDNEELKNHKGNYGVMGGGEKNLLIVDFDSEEVQTKVLPKLPETFTVRTGSGLLHKYFWSNKAESFKVFDESMNTLADVQGEGKQVVGAGSIHPNGNEYKLIEDKEIAFIDYAEIKAIMMAYDKKPRKKVEKVEKVPKEYSGDFVDDVKSNISLESVLSYFGVDTSKNPSNCPLHSSKGGKCLGWDSETAHCFHCEGSWNIFSFVMENKKMNFPDALEWLCENFGMSQEFEEHRKKWVEGKREEKEEEVGNLLSKIGYEKPQEENYEKKIRATFIELTSGQNKDWATATELLVEYVKSRVHIYTTKSDTKSETWIYDEGVYTPEGKSEIKKMLRNLLDRFYTQFIFGKVMEKIEPDTMIDADRFFSTNYKWEIPLQNGILNIKTLKLKPFDHQRIFFNKFPVKYVEGETCPQIEKFLKDVLSCEEDIDVFMEMTGFCLLKEYTFEKSFMLVGDGRNGKGKSLELVKRLVGADNVCNLPLASIVPDSFQISDLFNRMVNLAGDISNTALKDTSMFKALTGRDLVSGKRKFLNPINFENYAKFIFACNELPIVYDHSTGFWDRWVLLEFPYTFVNEEEIARAKNPEKMKVRDNDIINKISTEKEMSGFLNLALLGLHRLLRNKRFSLTKGTAQIKQLWIRKSNSFMAFTMDCLQEDYDSKISKKELRKAYTNYCKKHQIRPKSDYVIKKTLQEEMGVSEDRFNSLGNSWEWYWTGVGWKKEIKD